MQNFIHLEFKTYKPDGLLLYIEESSETIGQFLIQLFIRHGILQYQFVCGRATQVKNITTPARVDDGQWYKVQIRKVFYIIDQEKDKFPTEIITFVHTSNVTPFNVCK
ncbi:protein eyes shut homolog [Meleagris gallopavo]|uniref:protein eyes shut homolog n=1 Tax=Meleagris gallopavo TaxID=9103 RepID=UPI0012ABF0B0|nr:protein eyes shut homolog [Meleagris gallopavo]